jgi:hypothetical protein
MCATSPVNGLLAYEADERFVYERGPLDRVVGPFPAQVSLSERAQLPIEKACQLPERGLISAAPLSEESSYWALRVICHASPWVSATLHFL